MELFIIFYPILIFIFIILAISTMRSSKRLLTKKPKNLFPIISSKKHRMIIKVIIKFAADKKYEIDYFDSEAGIIILSKPLSFFSNGFFFPIYITQKNDEILIETGIMSKAVQIGLIPKRNLERFIHGIKAYLFCAESE